MIVHCLARNKKTVWYANPIGKTETIDSNGFRTGQYEVNYSEPVKTAMNIRWDNGPVALEPQGIAASGKRRMVTDDLNCPITLGTILWVDSEPQYGETDAICGSAECGMAVSGTVGTRTHKPTYYVCETPQKSLNHIVYIVQEVTVS